MDFIRRHLKDLPLIAVGVVLMFIINNVLITTRIQEIQFMLELVAQNTQDRLESARGVVELAAQTIDVQIEPPSVSEEYLKKVVTRDEKMWSHFLMAGPQGIEFVHTEGAQHYGKSIGDREYFLTPSNQGETVIAQPIHSVSTGRKIIAIGTPVARTDRTQTVLVGFIRLPYVSEILNAKSFTQNSYQMLSNADGTVSAHPNDDYVLAKNINELLPADFSRQILSSGEGFAVGQVEGTLSFMTYCQIPHQQLWVISVLPLHEAFYGQIVVNVVLIGILIVALLLLRARNRLTVTHRYAKHMALQAVTDRLTGLKNRRWLESVNLSRFCNECFTVLFFDVDNFKDFNDQHNHDYGDEVLRFVGESLRNCTRPKDVAVRYAGDEFLLLLQDKTAAEVEPIAKRLMGVLAEFKNTEGEGDAICISCGIASGVLGTDSLPDVITRADNAVYVAKRNGKNRVVVVA